MNSGCAYRAASTPSHSPASAVSALPPPRAIVPGAWISSAGQPMTDDRAGQLAREGRPAPAPRRRTHRRSARGRTSAPPRYARSAGRLPPRRRGRRSPRCARAVAPRSVARKAVSMPATPRSTSSPPAASVSQRYVEHSRSSCPSSGWSWTNRIVSRMRSACGQPRRARPWKRSRERLPERPLDEHAHELRLVLGGAGGVVHRRRILGCTGAGLRDHARVDLPQPACLRAASRPRRTVPAAAPTDPTATRASATAPPSTRATHATVAVGRSWKANFACAAPAPAAGTGIRTAVSTSPSPSAVWYGPATNAPIGTRRAASPPRLHSTSASSASRNVAGSEWGSEKQRFPPSVPTSRTRRFATLRSIAASAGSHSRTSSERSSSRCVTAPRRRRVTRSPPARRGAPQSPSGRSDGRRRRSPT